MDDKTTLEDLLKLELHKYEEEVKETVDRAVKEMSMEKFLKELHSTWDTLEFGKEVHERTKLNVLKIDEETIETLEENQVSNEPSIGIPPGCSRETVRISVCAGAAARYAGLEIRGLLLGRSDRLAAETQQRGQRDQRLVPGSTRLDALGEHLHRLGGYKKSIAGRDEALRED